MILAMPVIADRYWILKKDNRKVGQIEAQEDGYTVKISNTVKKYKTIKMLDRDIEFVPAVEIRPNPENQVYGYKKKTARVGSLPDGTMSKSIAPGRWYRIPN